MHLYCFMYNFSVALISALALLKYGNRRFPEITGEITQKSAAPAVGHHFTDTDSWAVQAGLLTPWTSARHRLSPLAAFTSGAYSLRNGRR